MKTREKKIILTVLYSVLITAIVVLLFFANFRIPFMMDDDWYSTNLATGEKLCGIKDVIESQWWHYNNWGGRIVTHGLLQLILMRGNLFADIFNTLFTLILAGLICRISFLHSSKKEIIAGIFLLAFSGLFAYNPNIKMSMLWEAGSVNYVYSSVWILCFIFPFLRIAEKPDSRNLPLINFWMIPLSLISGWSNENMGPTCFILSVTVIALRIISLKSAGNFSNKNEIGNEKLSGQNKKIPLWMITGAVGSFVGSVLCIIAPGNFVRVSELDKKPFLKEISERALSMINGGGNYLFIAVVTLAASMIVTHVFFKMSFKISELLTIMCIILSYGAMVLSPHYPDRASFGTMVLCIIGICTQFVRLNTEKEEEKSVSPLTATFTIIISVTAVSMLGFFLILYNL